MTEAITAPEPEVETRLVPIHGRDILVKRIGETQLMQLNHEAAVLQRDDLTAARLQKGLDRVYRTLTSTVVKEEDSDFLQDLMADGDLDIKELIEFIKSFHTETAPTNGPVRVQRGRAIKRT